MPAKYYQLHDVNFSQWLGRVGFSGVGSIIVSLLVGGWVKVFYT